MSTKQWSHYQSAVFENYLMRVGKARPAGMVVNAVAGSGKTTTLEELYRITPNNIRSVMIAFNSHIVAELEFRLPSYASVMTYHRLGLRALRRSLGTTIHVMPEKVSSFLDARMNDRWKFTKWAIIKLTSLSKGNLLYAPTNEQLNVLAKEYDVELFEKKSAAIQFEIFDLVRAALRYSMEFPTEVDFDDMIFLPLVLQEAMGIPIHSDPYDMIGVDEMQDTNKAQRQLLDMHTHENTMIVGVGDPKQAIYHFRGAGADAYTDFQNHFGADEFPLSISYRCPMSVGDYVRNRFPNIRFETLPDAQAGSVSNIESTKLLEVLKPNDLVLCRTNAPNVSLCLDLWRAGKRAFIKGEDVGKGMRALIKQSKQEDVSMFTAWMNEWLRDQVKTAMEIDSRFKLRDAHEKFDTMMALLEGAKTMQELNTRCDTLFSDKGKDGVVLSSVHRAKGLEADNVFIQRPDLLPHPSAATPVEIEQEENIAYVAYTRAKQNMTFAV